MNFKWKKNLNFNDLKLIKKNCKKCFEKLYKTVFLHLHSLNSLIIV